MTRSFRLACAAYVVAWVWAAARLPERVPLHFGPGGGADRWGSRTEALVTFALVGVGVAGVLWLCLRAIRRSSWQWVNVPHKDWWTATPARQERLRRLTGTDLAVLGAATMGLLAAALVGTVQASAQPDDPHLPGWVLLALAGYLAGVVAWTVWALTSRYRPDEDAP